MQKSDLKRGVQGMTLTMQRKCSYKATTAVPSCFVICISGAHIKQQTVSGPIVLSMFDRLSQCFELAISEIVMPCTEALFPFTKLTSSYCCLFPSLMK